MSNLVVVAYDDVATALAARDKLFELQRQHVVTLEDAAVVENRADGKVKLHQTRSTVGAGAAGGVLWGGLIGLLFFMPFLGMALGAATGAAMGATVDYGVDDRFMKELGEKLRPGGAALFVLVLDGTPDKVIPEMTQFGGQIIRTSLSAEQEEQLRGLVEHAQRPAAAQTPVAP
jgi:uncharacterized membrane protein